MTSQTTQKTELGESLGESIGERLETRLDCPPGSGGIEEGPTKSIADTVAEAVPEKRKGRVADIYVFSECGQISSIGVDEILLVIGGRIKESYRGSYSLDWKSKAVEITYPEDGGVSVETKDIDDPTFDKLLSFIYRTFQDFKSSGVDEYRIHLAKDYLPAQKKEMTTIVDGIERTGTLMLPEKVVDRGYASGEMIKYFLYELKRCWPGGKKPAPL